MRSNNHGGDGCVLGVMFRFGRKQAFGFKESTKKNNLNNKAHPRNNDRGKDNELEKLRCDRMAGRTSCDAIKRIGAHVGKGSIC